jgi:hypothetical protein
MAWKQLKKMQQSTIFLEGCILFMFSYKSQDKVTQTYIKKPFCFYFLLFTTCYDHNGHHQLTYTNYSYICVYTYLCYKYKFVKCGNYYFIRNKKGNGFFNVSLCGGLISDQQSIRGQFQKLSLCGASNTEGISVYMFKQPTLNGTNLSFQ